MTKATKVWMTIAIVSMVVSPIIGIVGLFVLGSLFSGFTSSGRVETYHKPAEIFSMYNTIFTDSDGSIYYTYGSSLSSLRKMDADGNVSVVSLPNCDNNRWLEDIGANDQYVYTSSTKSGTYLECKVTLMDHQFNEIKTIEPEHCVEAIEIYDGYMYCLFDSYRVEGEGNFRSGIEKYSLTTYERTLVAEEIHDNDIVRDGETMIYFHHRGPNYAYKDLRIVSRGIFESFDKYFYCYHQEYGKIEGIKVNDDFRITYGNKSFKTPLNYEHYKMCDYVYIKGDILLFVVREIVDNPDCPKYADDCICRHGKSTLMRFDLKNETYLESTEYDEQTVVLDFDENGAYYYYDGGLYDHGTLFAKCEPINTVGKTKVSEYDYLDYDYDYYPVIYYQGHFYGFKIISE